MTAEIVPATPVFIQRAAEIIRAGGIVAFPTETVYGLGANAFDASAVARIFAAKQRPTFDPLIVHLRSADQLSEVARGVADDLRLLAEHFWPGPLTVVVDKSERVPGIVTSGLDTVAVRVPSHEVAHDLLQAAGVPIAAPSANRFGGLSPTHASHVARSLGDAVDLIIDGGAAEWGVESTIVSTGPEVKRLGALAVEDIEAVVGPVVMGRGVIDGHVDSPGQLLQHYSPDARLVLVSQGQEVTADTSNAVFIGLDEDPSQTFLDVRLLSPKGDLVEAAAHLFETLHEVDHPDTTLIVAELVPEVGLGRAINDRLRRAAAKFA